MSQELPDWLRSEAEEFIAEIPKDEQASARAILDAGEFTVESWTTPNGTEAIALDLGDAELWTCPPDDVASS
ncbi:hypothetical protein L0U85_01790 [Glycomyces sp. L485]|uniref:hypothetical protein n=1 Tax=Glycomyces sp. L485 TaxID=2909235 RepID=UPI001F4B55C0|nr:hypothetical protein [Glycomyces sp. L485]MCH7229599.1 hypothetical protein [Glycomyces sp. L485]